MQQPATVIFDGLSRLHALELRSQFGEDAVSSSSDLPGIRLGSLSNDTVVVIVCTLPIIKALARLIARDRLSITYRSQRSDGSVDEGTLNVSKASGLADQEEESLVNKLTGIGMPNADDEPR